MEERCGPLKLLSSTPPPPPPPNKKIPSMHATVQVDTKCFLFNSNLEIRTEKYKRYINILLLLLTLDRET